MPDVKTWLEFEEFADTGKTKKWYVRSLNDGSILGTVLWYSKWRQYCYITNNYTSYSSVWNPDCLEELTAFIRARMEERKAK